MAEVWIDPEWYGCQSRPDPLPEPGPPTLVQLDGHEVLIGRQSSTSPTSPHIDCEGDAGVSRCHARLTRQGSGWVIEDLGSANGTYVAKAVGDIPEEPIEDMLPVRSGAELYLGSWTRIVLRQQQTLAE